MLDYISLLTINLKCNTVVNYTSLHALDIPQVASYCSCNRYRRYINVSIPRYSPTKRDISRLNLGTARDFITTFRMPNANRLVGSWYVYLVLRNGRYRFVRTNYMIAIQKTKQIKEVKRCIANYITISHLEVWTLNVWNSLRPIPNIVS